VIAVPNLPGLVELLECGDHGSEKYSAIGALPLGLGLTHKNLCQLFTCCSANSCTRDI